MPKDTYLQPDAPDDVWNAETVLALARRHAPHAQAVTHVDETGGEARSYAIDADLILKTQRPNRLRPRTNMAKEVFFLQTIAAQRPELSVPRVVGYGHDGPLVEYTLLTRMPGAALIRTKLDRAARIEVMRELGRTLRRIHSLPQQPFLNNPLFPGDRSAADMRRRIEELCAEFSERIRAERLPWRPALSPEQVCARALALLPDSDERVALHSNPWHEHTFVDPATGKYAGLIDFGDAYISHPTFDLRRWRERAEREALLEGYEAEGPVSEEFKATWIVAQVLGDMAAIAGSPGLAAAASEDLEGLIAKF